MAHDWIKMRSDIYRDPHISIMADYLLCDSSQLARYVDQNCQCSMVVTRNVMRNVTVGALVSIWGIMRHRGRRENDDLICDNVTPEVLDDVADLPGISSAMLCCGWLVSEEDKLIFPKFFKEYNEEPNNKNAERQKRYRQRNKGVTRYVTDSVTEGVTRNVTRNDREEIEKEKENTNTNPLPPLPANLQTDAFRAAWDEWQKHRKEKRATLTPTAAKRQLAELAEWGEADAIAAIQNSIKNGWQGIFPPKSSENTRKYKQTESGYDADRQLTL